MNTKLTDFENNIEVTGCTQALRKQYTWLLHNSERVAKILTDPGNQLKVVTDADQALTDLDSNNEMTVPHGNRDPK